MGSRPVAGRSQRTVPIATHCPEEDRIFAALLPGSRYALLATAASGFAGSAMTTQLRPLTLAAYMA